MTIVENTSDRLAIEWRPSAHTYAFLVLALWFTWEIMSKLQQGPIDNLYLLTGAILLTAFFYFVVYNTGQMTRLTLDRKDGTGVIFRKSILGASYRTLPLHELQSVAIGMVPGDLPLSAVVLTHRTAAGTERIMVPRAHQFSNSAFLAATAIRDWLDSARSGA